MRLSLQLENTSVRIAQIGDGFLILRDLCEAAPGTQANVVIAVDDDEVTYPVELTDGILNGIDLVDFTDLEACRVVNSANAIRARS